ncbi:queuosine-tRNA galactosyltransferase isoform X3 [Tursiops truncatus]|uniref:queuosine-tRNA galactosyltransferase isoform X3 n=1 Tax=Tursiops truncatus TaxID=9739 RepID=UPI003CCF9E39
MSLYPESPEAAPLGGEGPQPRTTYLSVILPVHDAEPWLDECLGSVLQQDFEGSMELSIFNDASKDKSMTIIEKWKEKLEGSGILVVIGGHDSPSPRGVGYSKNQAIAQSSGSYLCFLDSKIFLAVDYYFLHLQVVRPAPHPSWALVIPGSPQTRSLRTTLHSEAAELKDAGRRDDASEGEAATRSCCATPNKYHRLPSEEGAPQLHRAIHAVDQPSGARPAAHPGCPRGLAVLPRTPEEGRRTRPRGPEPASLPLPPRRGHTLHPRDHHLDPPRPLPGRVGPAPLGNLHHLECGPAGPPALPQPDGRVTVQGGRLLRCGREQDQEGLLLL